MVLLFALFSSESPSFRAALWCLTAFLLRRRRDSVRRPIFGRCSQVPRSPELLRSGPAHDPLIVSAIVEEEGKPVGSRVTLKAALFSIQRSDGQEVVFRNRWSLRCSFSRHRRRRSCQGTSFGCARSCIKVRCCIAQTLSKPKHD